MVRRHGRCGLSEHRHHRSLRGRARRRAGRRPCLQDGLRDHAPASTSRAGRRDDRLHRGAAPAGDRRSASCMSTRRTGSPTSSRSRPTRRASPGRPTRRSPAWASTSSTPPFSTTSSAATPPTAGSTHDFGKDMIPYLVRHGKAMAHRFARSCVKNAAETEAYWRDVGTIDAYWEANMDLTDRGARHSISTTSDWPIWTYAEITPPAKFVHDDGRPARHGVSSLVSGGCIISGAAVHGSLLFTRVHVHSCAELDEAVVLPEVDIARRCPAHERRHRPRRAHPRGPRRRRGPGARRQALPPHRERCRRSSPSRCSTGWGDAGPIRRLMSFLAT